MKTGLLMCLLAIAGINMFMPEEVIFLVIAGLLLLITPSDKARIYNSSYALILPLIVLVFIGVIRGVHSINKDFYRDAILFSKTIIYFIAGIALSKFVRLSDYQKSSRTTSKSSFFNTLMTKWICRPRTSRSCC